MPHCSYSGKRFIFQLFFYFTVDEGDSLLETAVGNRILSNQLFLSNGIQGVNKYPASDFTKQSTVNDA